MDCDVHCGVLGVTCGVWSVGCTVSIVGVWRMWGVKVWSLQCGV